MATSLSTCRHFKERSTHIVIAQQRFVMFVRETKLLDRVHANPFGSSGVSSGNILPFGGSSLANGNTRRQLSMLASVHDLDETCKNIGLPGLEERVIEFLDVSLEHPELPLQLSGVGLHLGDLVAEEFMCVKHQKTLAVKALYLAVSRVYRSCGRERIHRRRDQET